jgi:tetratricopeptide (TPR) repeat protein
MTRLKSVLVAATCLASTLAQTPPLEPWREYPQFDQRVATLARRGSEARRAEEQLRLAPAAAATIELLAGQDRIEDALQCLRQAVRSDLPTVLAALTVVGERFFVFTRDQSRGYPDTIRQIVEPLRARIATLSREDGARLAWALVSIDNQIQRGGSAGWADRVGTFVRQYDGTEAALLAQVSLISSGNGPLLDRIAVLDRFWKDHPGSAAGARALFEKGFQLHVNVPITGVERRGSDPTERLLQVTEIVKELESGRYPKGEWVTKAASLVSGFFVSQQPPPAYAPGNIERSISLYQDFVRTHFDANGPDDAIDSSVGYVITSRIGDLAERLDGRVAGVERTLADLEAHGADARAIELFRAQFWSRQATGPQPGGAARLAKARDALAALAAANAGYPSRKALATLASLEFYHRDYTRALPVYQKYVATYPASPWAWVAALRIGQCQEAVGDWRQAGESYQKVATAYASEPLARVLGRANAARASDAQGRFVESLSQYRQALGAWDPVYGSDYNPAATQAPIPAPATGPAIDWMRVTREGLTDRVAALERDAAIPGGLLLARGRWQLDAQQHAAARDTLVQFLKEFPASASAGEARGLVHRAQLELALELAAVEGPKRDDGAAMKALEALGAEPFDREVATARIATSALLLKQGATTEAGALMKATLDAWIAMQRPLAARAPAFPIDADVAAIRQVVFRPTGDLALIKDPGWNAFTFPPALPPVVITRADVPVKTADGSTNRHVIYQRFAGLDQVLLLTSDELTLIGRLISTIGGTRRREPAQIMETPNQPVGASVDIVTFWNRFFPARAGHWGGWVLETYPIITQIEFVNPERTKANANVTIGYSGATVVLEKVEGIWKAIRLTNQWIT